MRGKTVYNAMLVSHAPGELSFLIDKGFKDWVLKDVVLFESWETVSKWEPNQHFRLKLINGDYRGPWHMEIADPEAEVYEYRATLNRVYDADSIFLNINPGPGMWSREEAFRLLDIDAWEIRGEERPLGLKARDWLKDTLENANEIFIRSYKDKAGKYGRWLAWVFADGVDINKKLVKLGHAMAVKY